MFDIGGSELLVIGVVALIVVGPKDLPTMFRTLGRFTAKARGMAREFSRAMEDAAKSTGINEVSKDIKGLTSKKALGLDALEDAAKAFEKWDPKIKGGFAPGPLPDAKPAPVTAATTPTPDTPPKTAPKATDAKVAAPKATVEKVAAPKAASAAPAASVAEAAPAAGPKTPRAPRKRTAPKGEA